MGAQLRCGLALLAFACCCRGAESRDTATARAFGAKEGGARALDDAAEDPATFQLREKITSLSNQLEKVGVRWSREQSGK